MAEREGQQLGNYRLIRLLGRGGYAEVYLGEHMYLKNKAAIKLLRVTLQDEERMTLLQEAQTLVRLLHPHIVRVLDFTVEAGTPLLAMEYAPHGTLRQRYPRGTRLSLETVVPYVRQVASALQYAHDQWLIHRDVKPENMLLGSRDEVLLGDFGLAMLASLSYDNSTQALVQQVAGTSLYVAPEQLQGSPQPASDQYALGVVVYEWLLGRTPFLGSPIEVAMQHLSVPPPSLREQVPELPLAVVEVIHRALSKDPGQRYDSIEDFALALEAASHTSSQVLSTSLSAQEHEPVTPTAPTKSEAARLRVLIADDHPLFRNGMRALLASVPDMEVVGVATSGEEAISLAAALQPDVILMDVQMPLMSGIEATRRILQQHPQIRILVVTMFEDDATIFTALRAGAHGYVLKDADEYEILRAIRAVGKSAAIFGPAVAQRLVDYFATTASGTPRRAFPELTEREREILDLIARGYNNAEIARYLVLSLKTISNHVSNIFSKLQVTDRAQAIIRARDAGLGKG